MIIHMMFNKKYNSIYSEIYQGIDDNPKGRI
jgi:hypothetical protein